MNKLSLILLSALFLSACDATVPQPVTDGNAPIAPSAASPVIDLGSATGADILVRGISTIEGDITLHNNAVDSGDIEVNVSVRNTEASTTMQSDGKFVLEVPLSEIAQTVILDFEGPNVVPATVSLAIPAEADRVLVDADIAVRTPSIIFSLDRGGVMTNSLNLSRATARALTACVTTEELVKLATQVDNIIAAAEAEAASILAKAEADAAEIVNEVDAAKIIAEAEAEAASIMTIAEADAAKHKTEVQIEMAKVVADAEVAAAKIIADAEVDAAKITIEADAAKIIADAEAEAASMIAEAETQANKKIAESICGAQKDPVDTRVSVEVPALAFEFADGTLATGAGEVSITEIDIEDLTGSGAWAPNLVGLAEQASEEGALTTLGMTDFYFSQDGQPLQLRPGMSATISTDMLTTVVIPKGQTTATQVAAGMAIPLWYYDTVDMVWKEEGQSIVNADSNSQTGFSLSGDVSHFSTWNHDFIVPWTRIGVTVQLVDVNGQPYTALSVASHTLVASITSVQGTYGTGTPWSYPSNWVNTKNIIGDYSSAHMVAGNLSGNAAVTASAFDAGNTTMVFTASNIVTTGAGSGTLPNASTTKTKIFNNNDNDRTITIEVLVEEDPNNPVTILPVTVEIELIDLDDNVRTDINVTGYRVTAQSDTTPIWQDQRNLTPADKIMGIKDITEDQVNNGETISYEFTLDNLFIEGLGEFDLIFPVKATQEITAIGGTYTITLQVPVIDL